MDNFTFSVSLGRIVEEFKLEPLTSYVITSYSTYQLRINGEPIPEYVEHHDGLFQ